MGGHYEDYTNALNKGIEERDNHKKCTDELNKTRRSRDKAKKKLEDALVEIKLRKLYEGFLRSVIRSGESLSDEQDFEWFCERM